MVSRTFEGKGMCIERRELKTVPRGTSAHLEGRERFRERQNKRSQLKRKKRRKRWRAPGESSILG